MKPKRIFINLGYMITEFGCRCCLWLSTKFMDVRLWIHKIDRQTTEAMLKKLDPRYRVELYARDEPLVLIECSLGEKASLFVYRLPRASPLTLKIDNAVMMECDGKSNGMVKVSIWARLDKSLLFRIESINGDWKYEKSIGHPGDKKMRYDPATKTLLIAEDH